MFRESNILDFGSSPGYLFRSKYCPNLQEFSDAVRNQDRLCDVTCELTSPENPTSAVKTVIYLSSALRDEIKRQAFPSSTRIYHFVPIRDEDPGRAQYLSLIHVLSWCALNTSGVVMILSGDLAFQGARGDWENLLIRTDLLTRGRWDVIAMNHVNQEVQPLSKGILRLFHAYSPSDNYIIDSHYLGTLALKLMQSHDSLPFQRHDVWLGFQPTIARVVGETKPLLELPVFQPHKIAVCVRNHAEITKILLNIHQYFLKPHYLEYHVWGCSEDRVDSLSYSTVFYHSSVDILADEVENCDFIFEWNGTFCNAVSFDLVDGLMAFGQRSLWHFPYLFSSDFWGAPRDQFLAHHINDPFIPKLLLIDDQHQFVDLGSEVTLGAPSLGVDDLGGLP